MRKHRHIIPLSILFLVGCSAYEPPDYEEITNNFERNKQVYIQLQSMIETDTVYGSCSRISDRHIKGWWKHGELWNTNQDYQRKIRIDQVIGEVGLTKQRYEDYLSLLDKVRLDLSLGVSHCNALKTIHGDRSTGTRFGLAASGISVSGCVTYVEHRGNQPIPESEEAPGYFYIRVRIDEDWYIEHSCT